MGQYQCSLVQNVLHYQMFKHKFSFKLVSSSSVICSSNHADYEHMLKYISFGKVSL